jgi:hypothetical protein
MRMARRVLHTARGLLALSSHADEQMKGRSISDEEVIAVYENPDQVLPNRNHENARNLVRTINGRRIKMGVAYGKEPPVVITVFHWL